MLRPYFFLTPLPVLYPLHLDRGSTPAARGCYSATRKRCWVSLWSSSGTGACT